MHFGVMFLEIPRKSELALAEFTSVRVFRSMDHRVSSELIGMFEFHRAHCAMVLSEVLVVCPGVLVQDRFCEERLSTHLAAVPAYVAVAVHVIFESI